jgi:hypothetical protein
MERLRNNELEGCGSNSDELKYIKQMQGIVGK